MEYLATEVKRLTISTYIKRVQRQMIHPQTDHAPICMKIINAYVMKSMHIYDNHTIAKEG